MLRIALYIKRSIRKKRGEEEKRGGWGYNEGEKEAGGRSEKKKKRISNRHVNIF